jgi:hypothetical protein
LKFEHRPDYSYLRSLFEQSFKDKTLVIDDIWDWITHKKLLLDTRAHKELEEQRIKAMDNQNQGKLDRKKLEQINKLEKYK